MNKKYIAIVAATITVAALASLIGLQFGKTDEFPPQLGDLTLSHVEGGEKAMKSTEQLHDFSPALKMKDAYIIDYRGAEAESVRIWISRAEDHDEAYQLFQSMTRAIDPGDGFTSPEIVTLTKIQYPLVYHVEGFGSHHYYYAKKNSVYWLAFTEIPFWKQIDLVEDAIMNIE